MYTHVIIKQRVTSFFQKNQGILKFTSAKVGELKSGKALNANIFLYFVVYTSTAFKKFHPFLNTLYTYIYDLPVI
jgi:hypothetical protein